MPVTMKTIDPLVPNSNPFNSDSIRMGTQVGSRYVVMYSVTDGDELIVVDTFTGQRVQLGFPKVQPKISKWKNLKG